MFHLYSYTLVESQIAISNPESFINFAIYQAKWIYNAFSCIDFCDPSQYTSRACIYVPIQVRNQEILDQFIDLRFLLLSFLSRFLSRIELSTLLLARLSTNIYEFLDSKRKHVFLWLDSIIALN